MKRRIATITIALAVAVGTATGTITAVGQGRDSATSPRRFTATVDNPWFPLAPGTVGISVGVKDRKHARDVATVTHETTTIAGAPCRVVRDRTYTEGRLSERTTDYYTQDEGGNVWYFGERTEELDRHGRVTSTEGSWQAGVDGAKPGIFMPARPRVGNAYRQEFYRGHAEDHFRIIGLFKSTVSAPIANALLTRERTPLEPGVIDQKLYVRGIGTVVERTVKGGDEHFELESLRRGR
jgi:hypothetical protein